MRKYLILFVLVSMISCNQEPFYQDSYEINEGQWLYTDAASFSFQVESTDEYYDLVLDIDHAADYTYENVYVKILTTFPSGEKVEDQVSLQLADKLDQWEGRCSGGDCEVSILLQNKIRFREAGMHDIKISQHNRVNPLPGINRLTLKILDYKEG